MSALKTPDVAWGRLDLNGWLRDGLRLAARHYLVFVAIGLPIESALAVAAYASDDVGNSALRFALTLPLVAVITPVAKAAAIVALERIARGERAHAWTAYGPVIRRLPVVVAAAVLWFGAVATGLVLLVIPGLVVLVAGQCLMGAVAIEGRGVRDGFRRSWQLVRPVFWSVAALFVLLEVLGAGANTAVVAGLDVAFGAGLWVEIVGRVVTAPIVYVPLAVLFLDRRAALGDT